MTTNPFIAAVNVGPFVPFGIRLELYDAEGIPIPIFSRVSTATCGFVRISIPVNARFAAIRMSINNDTQIVFSNQVALGFENFLEYTVSVNGVISATLAHSATFPPAPCGAVIPPIPPTPDPWLNPCINPWINPCLKINYKKKCRVTCNKKKKKC